MSLGLSTCPYITKAMNDEAEAAAIPTIARRSSLDFFGFPLTHLSASQKAS
jgi:hypothetical protein